MAIFDPQYRTYTQSYGVCVCPPVAAIPEPAPDTSWVKEVDIRYDGKPRRHRPRWLRKATGPR